jgi:hypothetical protein
MPIEQSPKMTCHIRSYATEGRDKEGKKATIFVANCDPHGWRADMASRHGRQRVIDEHVETHRSK